MQKKIKLLFLIEGKTMKRKILLLLISLASIVGLTVWRTLIVSNYIDVDEKDVANGVSNGFFAADFDIYRVVFAAAIIAFIVLIFILCFTDKEYPGAPRLSSKSLAFTNAVYGVLILIYVFMNSKSVESVWDRINITLLLGVCIFVFYYSGCLFLCKSVARISAVVPLIYFVYRLCNVFINSFGIIKSSEITLHVLSLIFCVLFFEFYARYVGRIKFRRARKLILFSGIIAVALICVSCIPKYIVATRSYPKDSFLLLCTAFYIALFLFISFSKKELYRKYSEISETNYEEVVD